MCVLLYQKTNSGRAMAFLFHTQKSEEKNCEIHNFFLRLDFAEALAQFASIIPTLTPGFRIESPLFIPGRDLTIS
jgi:hypothetical protein